MVLGLDMRFLGRKREKINQGEATSIESVVSPFGLHSGPSAEW
jgi:hypothetical protein